MEFGLFYITECPSHDYRRAYAEMLDQIERSEELGFTKVWIAEHHGSDYGSLPSPPVMAAAIAERTKQMKIGIMVSNITMAHPTRIAEDYAMADVISNGRLIMGVGRGYQPREFANLGLAHVQDQSREIFAEALEIITGLWENDTFSFHGEHFQLDEVDLRPKPVQQPRPPINVAAISPATFDMIARQGHNAVVSPGLSTLPELIETVVAAKRIMVDAGRDPLTLNFPMNWVMHVAETTEQAIAEATPPMQWYFAELMKHVPQGPNAPKGYELYAEAAAASSGMEFNLDMLREAGTVLVSDPAGAIEILEKLHDEMGLQDLSCQMQVGGMDHELVLSSMEVWAEHVIPHFKDRAPVVPLALRESAVGAS